MTSRKTPAAPTMRDIIDLWPSKQDFATEIDISLAAARKMYTRDSVDDIYWEAVVAAARKRRLKTATGESVTNDLLVAIAARKRREKKVVRKRPPPSQAA